MHKKGHNFFSNHMIPRAKFTSEVLYIIFQGSKWGIVRFSIKNTLGDTAKIKFEYFIILCIKFAISEKNKKCEKWKISYF